MKDKDKIILLVYAGTKNVNMEDTADYIKNLSEGIKWFDDSVKVFIVPDPTSERVEVDCINPKLLNEEKYKEVEDTIERFKKLIQENEQ